MGERGSGRAGNVNLYETFNRLHRLTAAGRICGIRVGNGFSRTVSQFVQAAAKKGKLYTADEKQAVVDFANTHNAEYGRGGVTAAVKKFGASALTIASWVKSVPGGSHVGKGRAESAGGSSKRGSVLAELSKLDQVIDAKRKELDALEARFQRLKASL